MMSALEQIKKEGGESCGSWGFQAKEQPQGQVPAAGVCWKCSEENREARVVAGEHLRGMLVGGDIRQVARGQMMCYRTRRGL